MEASSQHPSSPATGADPMFRAAVDATCHKAIEHFFRQVWAPEDRQPERERLRPSGSEAMTDPAGTTLRAIEHELRQTAAALERLVALEEERAARQGDGRELVGSTTGGWWASAAGGGA